MKRFGKENLAVLQGEKEGFFYDAVTNSVFKTTLENVKIAKEMQEKAETDESVAAEFEQFFQEYMDGKPEIQLGHENGFETKHLAKLTMMMATTCNLRCKYCYAHYGEYSGYEQKIMSREEAISYLEALNERFHQIDRIQFFGGEPLLAIDAIDAVCEKADKMVKEGLLEKIPQYTMITNLTLIDKRALNVIQKNNIRLTVSLDGPAEINDQLRIDSAGKGTFETISRNIQLCRGQINAFEATFTRLHEQAGFTMESLREYIAKTFEISELLIYICPALGTDQNICFGQDEAKKARLGFEQLDFDNIACLYGLKPENQNDLLCTAGYNSIAVMPNGDLYPCHFYALDRQFCMGKYERENGFQNMDGDIDRVQSLLRPVNKTSHKECKECWARNICHRCPAELLVAGSQQMIDFECDSRKSNWNTLLTTGLEKYTK